MFHNTISRYTLAEVFIAFSPKWIFMSHCYDTPTKLWLTQDDYNFAPFGGKWKFKWSHLQGFNIHFVVGLFNAFV